MIEKLTSQIVKALQGMNVPERVDAINDIREQIHQVSPFKDEPVDFVRWVPAESVKANDCNPNSVAPPEMELLEHSIVSDGYTQPIVSWKNGEHREVVDGFHRHRVGRESDAVRERIHGYLPAVTIKQDREGRNDRIAATIRHNRARGKHRVDSMSDIVIELKKRNWSDSRIAKELGMDADEVLRLCQITGLSEVFSEESFSQAWDAVIMEEYELAVIDEEDIGGDPCNDEERIFHEWEDWECYPAGFYNDKPPKGMTVQECEESYRDMLADIPRFERLLERVISEWKHSCEHYLTNQKMNRIAWLGQAAMCIDAGIPSRFCGGYNLLSDEQKEAADRKAHEYLNKWLTANGRQSLTWEQAQSKTKANIY